MRTCKPLRHQEMGLNIRMGLVGLVLSAQLAWGLQPLGSQEGVEVTLGVLGEEVLEARLDQVKRI